VEISRNLASYKRESMLWRELTEGLELLTFTGLGRMHLMKCGLAPPSFSINTVREFCQEFKKKKKLPFVLLDLQQRGQNDVPNSKLHCVSSTNYTTGFLLTPHDTTIMCHTHLELHPSSWGAHVGTCSWILTFPSRVTARVPNVTFLERLPSQGRDVTGIREDSPTQENSLTLASLRVVSLLTERVPVLLMEAEREREKKQETI